MKPSLEYMKGGIGYGDVHMIDEDTDAWSYLGNSRSDFDRFRNDFWITVSRGDNIFLMLFVTIWFFALAGVHYFLKSSWTGVFLMIGVLVAAISLFYLIITFFSSLKKFLCYKKEYNSVYQKWIEVDSERRRNYIKGQSF